MCILAQIADGSLVQTLLGSLAQGRLHTRGVLTEGEDTPCNSDASFVGCSLQQPNDLVVMPCKMLMFLS